MTAAARPIRWTSAGGRAPAAWPSIWTARRCSRWAAREPTGPFLRLKPAGTGRFENFTGSPQADIVYADPLAGPTRSLDGGVGTDALWFEAPGVDVTDNGSVLAASGFGNVTYSNFESTQVWGAKEKIVDNSDPNNPGRYVGVRSG